MLPNSELADRLHSAAIHLLRGVRREDAAAGLPPAQLSALSRGRVRRPAHRRRLAEAEQVRSPTMTRIVTALAAAGLVTKRASPRRRARDVGDAPPTRAASCYISGPAPPGECARGSGSAQLTRRWSGKRSSAPSARSNSLT